MIAKHRFWMIAAFISVFALWLRTGLSAHIIADAGNDDRLFVRLGEHLLYGDWLGPFNNVTLVKGVGYPIFLALCFLVGVPVVVSENIVYLGVCLAAALLVGRLSRSWAVAGILFTALALDPVLWHDQLARIIREGFYVSLTLGSLLMASLLAFSRVANGRMWAVSVAAGVTWAWFWLTREEGIWLVPSVLLISAVGAVSALKTAGDGSTLAKLSLARLGVAFVTAMVLTSAVATINRVRYGAYETVEVRSKPFERAYGSLTRVRPSSWRRYVVVPADVRRKVYAVSPAARELAPYFEGPQSENFRRAGCDNMPGIDCSEILAGWFQWAFREAVAAAGHYRSAATAAAFYNRLADEIGHACDRGALNCTPARASLAPPFRSSYLADTLLGIPKLANIVWTQGLHPTPPTFTTVSDPSAEPSPAIVTPMTDFVGLGQPTAIEAATTRRASHMRSMAIFKLISIISSLYAPILVAMVLLSFLGAVGLWSGRRTPAGLALLTLFLACYVAVGMRILLLAYIDATAIPSINILYWSPASPLLIVAAVIGACFGLPRLVFLRRHVA